MFAVTAILSCVIKIRGLFKSTKWRHFENVKFDALSAQCVRPNIVYVPTEWSLRFYAVHCTKSHTTFTHVVYDFEYICTLPLSHMLLTLLRLTTKKNYKSYPLVMKPVGPYRNIKHVTLFSQADTKLISSRQIISSCQGHSYKSLLLL